ncbi:hypothetical protein CBM2595_A30943 [Cupriavidus taiwanensis]|uniref:Uncharacterized protein n=1 Tax=Cupriavidus taiwanensis TaxID=164546 RepID=A0A7Z7J706_9BURK|nr:hypothetical protein CBM2595_A30943 [Cupriavidus taiwanensis]SOZ05125.1 hypothetical protein CBM2597_A51077 [Cupriavidus taiwanensis]SPC09608.1 hypothetical protein CBM2594_A40931 [Cupriavidus taiwanensis]
MQGEFDALGGRPGPLPKTDPAVPPQRDLVTAQNEWLAAVHADVGAVRAAVDQHVSAGARLGRGLEAGREAVRHHDGHAGITPDGDRRRDRVHLDHSVPIAQGKKRGIRQRLIESRDQGQVGGLLPDRFVQLHRLRPAAHVDGVQVARHLAQRRRKVRHRVLAGDDLSARRQPGQPGGEVHGIAKDIARRVEQDRAMVEADVGRHGEARHRRQFGNRALHVQCRLQGLLRAGKQHHDLVADGLDEPALRRLGTRFHRTQATADRGKGGGVARPFIEPRTAADIREQYRTLRRLVQQFPVHVHPDPSRQPRAATPARCRRHAPHAGNSGTGKADAQYECGARREEGCQGMRKRIAGAGSGSLADVSDA